MKLFFIECKYFNSLSMVARVESAILDQAYTWLVSAFPIVQLCDAYTYSQIYFDWKH